MLMKPTGIRSESPASLQSRSHPASRSRQALHRHCRQERSRYSEGSPRISQGADHGRILSTVSNSLERQEQIFRACVRAEQRCRVRACLPDEHHRRFAAHSVSVPALATDGLISTAASESDLS